MARGGGFSSRRRGILAGVNVGGGHGIYRDATKFLLDFKTLVAGANITLNSTPTTVEITGSGGGAANPGGSDTEVQYNDDGLFNGDSSFIFDKTTPRLTLPQAHVSGTLFLDGNLIPEEDTQYNLGSTAKRWSNVYTGDLHLKNERGDWTLFEEETKLMVKNNLTGEFFNLMLEKQTESP